MATKAELEQVGQLISEHLESDAKRMMLAGVLANFQVGSRLFKEELEVIANAIWEHHTCDAPPLPTSGRWKNKGSRGYS